ncbi:MAG: alpha/beta fold hydrolase [Egibacteraceae bacterium]
MVAPDLPSSDPTARLGRYVQEVIEAISDRDDLVVVGQSLGGLIAPLVCDRVPSRLLVLVAAMIPAPGETGGEWWEATGQPDAAAHLARAQGRDESKDFDPFEWFLHDVPTDIVEQSAAHVGEQSDGPFIDPWPLSAWPSVPTRVIACRNGRMFPLEFMRRLSRERLGIEPVDIDSGHLPALAAPDELTAVLERFRADLTAG